jgi:hypothetical protein
MSALSGSMLLLPDSTQTVSVFLQTLSIGEGDSHLGFQHTCSVWGSQVNRAGMKKEKRGKKEGSGGSQDVCLPPLSSPAVFGSRIPKHNEFD